MKCSGWNAESSFWIFCVAGRKYLSKKSLVPSGFWESMKVGLMYSVSNCEVSFNWYRPSTLEENVVGAEKLPEGQSSVVSLLWKASNEDIEPWKKVGKLSMLESISKAKKVKFVDDDLVCSVESKKT